MLPVEDLVADLLDRTSVLLHDHWPALLVLVVVILGGRHFYLPISLQKSFRSMASNRIVAYATVLFLSVASSIAATTLHGLPLPGAHDDFAYLLSGEIF